MARWITYTLQAAGIDDSIFVARSSQTESTSHSANAQLPLADILKAEHLNKPISGNLGQTLLTDFDSAGQSNLTSEI